MQEEYLDGSRLEIVGSCDDRPPRDGAIAPPLPASVWARVGAGPWRQIPGENSPFAAATRIQGCNSASEAFARLCPEGAQS
jgi:hypothetical protein